MRGEYLESGQGYGEKNFVEMINSFKLVTVAPKGSVLDVRLVSEYTHYKIHERRLLEKWDYDVLCISTSNTFRFVSSLSKCGSSDCSQSFPYV